MKDFFIHLQALPRLADLGNAPESTVEISLIVPAKNAAETLDSTVREADAFLRSLHSDETSNRKPPSFEIILVPNPAPGDRRDRTVAVAEGLALKFPSVKICRNSGPCGKGAALRSGVAVARGKWIFYTDADLPYDLDFFEQALEKLESGYDLVSGNRRLAQSIFHIPVSLLPIAYGRHRLGLAFNRLVRWLLSVPTTDTQAGIKALSRRLALEAFSRQICPGFLFDLEVFLTATGFEYRQTELPVVLNLNSEKSTVRILRECILVGYWLTRLTIRNWLGAYRTRKSRPHKTILRRYQRAPFVTRIFLTLRWLLTPYGQMAAHLPKEGVVLDLGCGHGLFALRAALASPTRQVVGIDHDATRISLGTEAVRDLDNVQLSQGNLSELSQDNLTYAGVAMIDIMHYFDLATQETLFKQVHQLLRPGGVLLVREVNPHGGAASSWNRFYEKVATKIGFTQSEKKDLYFRSIRGWTDLLESVGFKVQSEPCTSVLFADTLFICERD